MLRMSLLNFIHSHKNHFIMYFYCLCIFQFSWQKVTFTVLLALLKG